MPCRFADRPASWRSGGFTKTKDATDAHQYVQHRRGVIDDLTGMQKPMRWKLARIAQIDIFLHWTFFLAPAYLVYQWRWGEELPWTHVAILLGLLIAVFSCVLMHEYGHALMARFFGVQTKDIIITPIGGLARLERMPRNPFQELMITLAGPAVNLVIAFLLGIYVLMTGGKMIPEPGFDGLLQIPVILMWMNLVLFLFNLIPAFPMDGGRILRSGLAFFLPHQQATRVAAILGQICASVFAIYGLIFQQYSFVLIGAFVFFAARHEMRISRFVIRREFPPAGFVDVNRDVE